jgi:lipopolysaccharide transport system permease protein
MFAASRTTEGSRVGGVAYVRDAWSRRELLRQLAWRDIKAERKQSLLGLSWVVLQPLAQMAVFTLVFSLIVPIKTAKPYPIFAFTGLVTWGFLSATVSRASGSILAHANLVRKVYFPREFLIYAATISGLVNLAANVLVLAVMMMAYALLGHEIALSVHVLWLAPVALVSVLLAQGAAFLLSALNAFWRDIGHALPLLLQVWFYATPIVYPLDRVPDRLLPWYRLNPMVAVVTSTRNVLLEGAPPDYELLGIAAGVSAGLFLAGLIFFKRCEPHFADLI